MRREHHRWSADANEDNGVGWQREGGGGEKAEKVDEEKNAARSLIDWARSGHFFFVDRLCRGQGASRTACRVHQREGSYSHIGALN